MEPRSHRRHSLPFVSVISAMPHTSIHPDSFPRRDHVCGLRSSLDVCRVDLGDIVFSQVIVADCDFYRRCPYDHNGNGNNCTSVGRHSIHCQQLGFSALGHHRSRARNRRRGSDLWAYALRYLLSSRAGQARPAAPYSLEVPFPQYGGGAGRARRRGRGWRPRARHERHLTRTQEQCS